MCHGWFMWKYQVTSGVHVSVSLQSSVHPLVPLLLYSDTHFPLSSPYSQPIRAPAAGRDHAPSETHPCYHGNGVTRWVVVHLSRTRSEVLSASCRCSTLSPSLSSSLSPFLLSLIIISSFCFKLFLYIYCHLIFLQEALNSLDLWPTAELTELCCSPAACTWTLVLL